MKEKNKERKAKYYCLDNIKPNTMYKIIIREHSRGGNINERKNEERKNKLLSFK